MEATALSVKSQAPGSSPGLGLGGTNGVPATNLTPLESAAKEMTALIANPNGGSSKEIV